MGAGEVDDEVYRWALAPQVVDDGQLDFDALCALDGGKKRMPQQVELQQMLRQQQ